MPAFFSRRLGHALPGNGTSRAGRHRPQSHRNEADCLVMRRKLMNTKRSITVEMSATRFGYERQKIACNGRNRKCPHGTSPGQATMI